MMFHAELNRIKRHQQRSQVLVSGFSGSHSDQKPGGPGRATAGDQEPRLARSGMQFSSIIVAKGTVTSQGAEVADFCGETHGPTRNEFKIYQS